MNTGWKPMLQSGAEQSSIGILPVECGRPVDTGWKPMLQSGAEQSSIGIQPVQCGRPWIQAGSLCYVCHTAARTVPRPTEEIRSAVRRFLGEQSPMRLKGQRR
jgi:hypothetical protein